MMAFKKTLAALALGATALGGVAATPAFARDNDKHDNGRGNDRRGDNGRGDNGRHDNGRHNGWDNNRRPDHVVVVRPAPPPRVVYRYDYNRPDPSYGHYYADRYYRAGPPIRVTRETRIYRGYDNRYYCRRSDGTTGLIVGGAIGGVLGSRLDRGNSSILGTVLGAGAGALLGQSLDRGQLVCR